MEMDAMTGGEGPRREFSRVDAYVPFECRIVGDEGRDHVQARILGNPAAPELRPIQDPGDHDHVIGEWLKVLNFKLDMVIRLITLQHEGFCSLPSKAVSISGGGMSFTLPESVDPGTILEIKLMLTRNPPVAMCIYGEVAKCLPKEQGHFVAIRYVQMDASVRDEIIRFVFEREREIIREKRR